MTKSAPPTTVLKALIPAVREAAAHDPNCPYSAEECRTLPVDEHHVVRGDYAMTARAVIVAFLKAAYEMPGETREWTMREWALALEKIDHG